MTAFSSAVASLVLGLLPVRASADTDGRYLAEGGACCAGTVLDGLRAGINLIAERPPSDNCVTFSVVGDDYTGVKQQVEVGVVRCADGQSVGACSQHGEYQRFVETWNENDGYHCNRHGTQDIDTNLLYAAKKVPGEDNTWGGYLSGDKYETQVGFADAGKEVKAWGEVTTDCNADNGDWLGTAEFTDVQYLRRDNGWQNMVDTSFVRFPMPRKCFHVSAFSGGSFSVHNI